MNCCEEMMGQLGLKCECPDHALCSCGRHKCFPEFPKVPGCCKSIIAQYSDGTLFFRAENAEYQINFCPWCGTQLNMSLQKIDDS